MQLLVAPPVVADSGDVRRIPPCPSPLTPRRPPVQLDLAPAGKGYPRPSRDGYGFGRRRRRRRQWPYRHSRPGSQLVGTITSFTLMIHMQLQLLQLGTSQVTKKRSLMIRLFRWR